jgi:hypothetical protein
LSLITQKTFPFTINTLPKNLAKALSKNKMQPLKTLQIFSINSNHAASNTAVGESNTNHTASNTNHCERYAAHAASKAADAAR